MVVLFTDSPVIYYLLCLCLSSKYKTSRSSNGSVHNGSGYGNRYYQEYRFVGILQIQFYWFHTSFRIGNQAARRHFFPTGSMAAVVFILFIVCCFNQYLWLLTFGLLTIAVLPLARALHSNNRLYATLKWLGGISAFLFVTPPIVRMHAWDKTRFLLSVYLGIYISKHIICVGIQETSGVVQKQNRIQTKGIIYGSGRKFIL